MDLTNEIWYWIPNFEGKYQYSTFGNVRSFIISKGKISRTPIRHLKTPLDRKGYPNVTLRSGARKEFHNFLIHQLVASNVDNPENKPYVNHKNGIKTDNNIKNLEWCTCKENLQHAFKIGLMNHAKGERCGRSKLNPEQVIEILNSNKKCRELAIIYGVNNTAISGIRNGSYWNHITKLPKRQIHGKYRQINNNL